MFIMDFSKELGENLKVLFQNNLHWYSTYLYAWENHDEFVRYIMSEKFLSNAYQGKFHEYNALMIDAWKKMPVEMKKENETVKDMRETNIAEAVTYRWRKYKRIYTFDRDLEKSLSDMEKCKMNCTLLSMLPLNCFYIEFDEYSNLGQYMEGILFDIVWTDNSYLLSMIRIGRDKKFYTDFEEITLNSIFDISRDYMTKGYSPNIGLPLDTFLDYKIFIHNALLYLCASNADILENEITKQTYKKTNRIKDKFSELERFDVGKKYGTIIRHICNEESDKKTTSNGHKSPRPHIRCAHWQTYHVGKDRKETRLVWKQPVFVNGNEYDIAEISQLKVK